VVTHQLQVERRTAKDHWPETDVLPLSHAEVDKKNCFFFKFDEGEKGHNKKLYIRRFRLNVKKFSDISCP